MISYLCICLMVKLDRELKIVLSLEQIFCMALTELVIFLVYIDFGLKYISQNQIIVVLIAITFSIYVNITAYIDLWTGYVYSIINLISFGIILYFSIVFLGISPEFIYFFIFYMGIINLCEMIKAFCHGDTEFLTVSYWYFTCKNSDEFAICSMFKTLLLSAVLFDVFRRITGRKGEFIPYTPFIVLSEFINIVILNCIGS